MSTVTSITHEGEQAEHLARAMLAHKQSLATEPQRLAFEVAESDARADLLAACCVTAIGAFGWLVVDPIVDICAFLLWGDLK